MRSAGEMDQADAELRATICKVGDEKIKICFTPINVYIGLAIRGKG